MGLQTAAWVYNTSLKVSQMSPWVLCNEILFVSREMYLDDNMWKANLKLKPKGKPIEAAMSGSFKTLSID